MRHRVPEYLRRVQYRIFSNKICLFVPYGLITKTCRKMNILPNFFFFFQNEIVQEKFKSVHNKRDCLKKAKNIPNIGILAKEISSNISLPKANL